MNINNSKVCGSNYGINNYGTLTIKGGEYSGVGHGGFYLAGGTAYIEDAVIKTTGYAGKFKSLYNYSVQYRAAGFYFGGITTGGVNAYFDNCEIINEREDRYLFAMTETPTTNSNIYMSCCILKGDGVVICLDYILACIIILLRQIQIFQKKIKLLLLLIQIIYMHET